MEIAGLSTALLPIAPPVIAVSGAAGVVRRPGRRDPVDDVLDDVPYIVVEAPEERAGRTAAPARRTRRAGGATAARGVWSAPRPGPRSSSQRQALRAYAPYYAYQGIFVDVWV